MILYSIIPVEVVFNHGRSQDEVQLIEADYRGQRVQVIKMPDQQYRVVRLLSTDLKTYLNPIYQPGSIVRTNDLRFQETNP